MKRTKYLIISVLICAFAACVFAACSGKAKEKEVDNEYKWSYSPAMSEACDDDMKIDGVLDEERWQDKKALVHSDRGITMTVKTAFSEKGVYIGATAEDENITYTSRMNYQNNSGFWFSVKREDVTYAIGTEVFDFYVDGKTASNMNDIRFNAKGATNKPYSEKPNVLTAELFVTWDALNIELGENGELPDCIRINPHYRYISATSTNVWLNPMFFFDDRDRQECSGRFGKDGYINADKADLCLGNAANGYAMSDGWDLSASDSGLVVSDVDHSQGIFFKDIYSSAYTYTVRISVNDENLYGKNPSGAGVLDARNQIECSTFYLDAMSVRGKRQTTYNTLSFYKDGAYGWVYKGEGYFKPEYKNGNSVTYTVVKDGGNFYYIVDGVFLMSKYVSYLSEESCPGFFTLDTAATFSDYSAEDLSGNDAKIDEILNSYGAYRIKTPDVITGGSVELTANAVKAGESVSVTLLPSNGFVLTGLTVNGEDKYDEITAVMESGTFTIDGIEETVSVVPTFTRVRDTVRIFGTVRDENGNPVSRAKISLNGNSGMMYYSVTSDETGSYAFNVPAAGNVTLGGKDFVFGSEYAASVKATGFMYLTDTVTLGEDKSQNINYVLERPEYSNESYGVITLGENEYSAADNLTSRKTDYKFFDTKNVTTAVIKAKVTVPHGASFPSRYGIGITVTDGSVLTEDFHDTENTVRKKGEYLTKEIGLTELGIYCSSYMICAKQRFPGVWGGGTFSELQYSDSGLSVWAGVSERTLTVLLFNNRFYIYIDDTFIIDVGADKSDYWACEFTKGSYRFGIYFAETQGIDVTVKTEELYGDEARDYIQQNHGDITKFTQERIKFEDGVYTDTGSSYRTSAYCYTSPDTFSDTAVYSVKINASMVSSDAEGIYGYNDWATNVGITLTDGTYMNVPIDGRDASAGRFFSAQIGLSKEGVVSHLGGVIAMSRRITAAGFSYMGSVAADKYALTAGNMTDRVLTVALYKDKLYIYADGEYLTSVSLNDNNLHAVNASSGYDYAFRTGGEYTFGVNISNVDRSKNAVSAEVVKELYGADALADIRENFTEIDVL